MDDYDLAVQVALSGWLFKSPLQERGHIPAALLQAAQLIMPRPWGRGH